VDEGDRPKSERSADIILLLISASFIASTYCWSIEMRKAEAKAIPVILRPCRWDTTPFAKLQSAPKNAKPVTSWSDQDAALDDVADKIQRIIKELRSKQTAEKYREFGHDTRRNRRLYCVPRRAVVPRDGSAAVRRVPDAGKQPPANTPCCKLRTDA
jgi:hypothetical protein